MKRTLTLLTALLLAPLAALHATDKPAQITHTNTAGKFLSDCVKPEVDYPGKIAASEVVMRGLFPRPSKASDPHNTLEAIKGFHATRLEWIYKLTPEFVRDVRKLGVSVSGVTSGHTAVIDKSKTGWLADHNILDLNLKPTYAPWAGNNPMPWLCMNNPSVRDGALADLKKQIDMGVRDFQRDGPEGNKMTTDWGACFCPHCMKAFREWLPKNLSAAELRVVGVEDVKSFDYRQYLLARNAPIRKPVSSYPGTELAKAFIRFQTKTTISFHKWWHEEINRYAGRYVPISCNNYGFVNTPLGKPRNEHLGVYDVFDFGIGEFNRQFANPQFLYDLARSAHAKGKRQTITMPLDKNPEKTVEWKRTIRQSIATAYATGMHMEAPWDTYLPNPDEIRFFGDPADFADLYAMVRAASRYLDGYVDAAAVGSGIGDPRWSGIGNPVGLDPANTAVAAFTRARPGERQAPIVVHLVDWSGEPGPFNVTLRPDLLFGGQRFKAALITPKPYLRSEHDEAFNKKDYKGLINRIPLTVGPSSTLTIPALRPWGILILTPVEQKM